MRFSLPKNILQFACFVMLALYPVLPANGALSKRLLLDGRVVAATSGVELVLGRVEKDNRNPLFGADRPWEQKLDNVYANVLYDEQEKLYRCWYSPFIVDPAVIATPIEKRVSVSYADALRRAGGVREMGLCYATSIDGIKWDKPALNLFEYEGSRSNNLVMRVPGEGPHGTGVTYVRHAAEANQQYQALFSLQRQLWLANSADGLHWDPPRACRGIQVAGDTHNNLLWDADRRRYVLFTRTWENGVRQVARTESTDLQTWAPVETALQGRDREQQTYALNAFCYADVYLGLLMVLDLKTDHVQCELSWSPDTVRWHRLCPGTPLIKNGLPDSYDSGCVFAGAAPIVQANQMLLYYGSSNGPHGNWRDSYLCRAQLPRDRWAGYEPTARTKPGFVITRPIECRSRTVRLSADAEGGSVTVTLLGADHQVLAVSEPVTGNVTDCAVQWRSGGDVAGTANERIRMRFDLQRARLFAFECDAAAATEE